MVEVITSSLTRFSNILIHFRPRAYGVFACDVTDHMWWSSGVQLVRWGIQLHWRQRFFWLQQLDYSLLEYVVKCLALFHTSYDGLCVVVGVGYLKCSAMCPFIEYQFNIGKGPKIVQQSRRHIVLHVRECLNEWSPSELDGQLEMHVVCQSPPCVCLRCISAIG